MSATLFGGPDPRPGPEPLAEHERRLGPLPPAGADLIPALEASGLLGRGGAAFPVGAKWRSVAERAKGAAVVLANGAEGEPLSRKDQALLWARPHLVLDGALLAAGATGAGRIVLYVGEAHEAAAGAVARALAERPPRDRRRFEVVRAPARYVAGEESAAIRFVETGVAAPRTTPPRPYERGVDGRPTLVQNVESLAHAALVARTGAASTLLLTVSGAVTAPGVREVAAGLTVGEAVGIAGGLSEAPRAVLLGGYFGAWLDVRDAWSLPLEAAALRQAGGALGCGVVHVLPAAARPVAETAGVMRYLAGESAAQCGPCFFGLRSLADACARLAAARPEASELERLHRWSDEVRGRGACRHPDGAVGFLRSALRTFEPEFAAASRGGAARRVA
ncbi:MAG TPA: NADH-ubiquinone oxidoreductase-F iron-sulfur binding region domain-containing protein [Candidatus Dormibacteraeota bacterium]|nr:NADH-ubiquinone oxidoreductase-F iron-sulfur binding region domain-containing protein [Candidatus Dormibacteraeota bacterium]